MSEQATVGGGCFWCVEAAFERVRGVESVVSGYAGGHVADPTYEAVCRGDTGHAEVVQITYDPDAIGYDELLSVFFAIHDPTTEDREGPDVGSQYRSVIFAHDDRQLAIAEQVVESLESSGAYDDPIVTEIEVLETFHEAEKRHQDYFLKHPTDAYCRMHAAPKVERVREGFSDLVVDE
jgi:peptide-methionine (S)-S-oxide reductase